MGKQVLSVAPNGQFYGGAPNRAPGLINGWTMAEIDARMDEIGTLWAKKKLVLSCVN